MNDRIAARISSDLLENKDFQDLIATRLAELLAGSLSDESVTHEIDQIAAVIRDEIPLESERWGYDTIN